MGKKVILLIFIVIILTTILFIEKYNYPIIYKVCGLGYTDCTTIAKFHTREDCETTNKKWGWYCDQTDKSHIICQEKESNIAIGYCD